MHKSILSHNSEHHRYCKSRQCQCAEQQKHSNFIKNNEDYNKLDEVIKLNLESLNKIIDYNIKNNIHFYRISSNLVPLASMQKVKFETLTFDEKQTYCNILSSLIRQIITVYPFYTPVKTINNTEIFGLFYNIKEKNISKIKSLF